MNILHVGNPANVAIELRNAQRAAGHESNVVQVYRPSLRFNFPEDYRIYDERGLLSKLAYRMELIHLINNADVIHAHGGFWHRGLTRYIGLMGKKLVIHYHGSDLRNPGSGARRNEHLARLILLSTPDLQQYSSRGIYVPNPLDIQALPPNVKLHLPMPWREIGIVHGHSEHKDLEGVKGSDTIAAIMQDLSSETGVLFIRVRNLDHSRALSIYAQCDIAIDQLRIGRYGMFALECMGMGILTVGYKTPYQDRSGMTIPNPLFPVDDSTLKGTLQMMIDNPAERVGLGDIQREFVREHHNPLKIAKTIQAMYEGI